MITYSTYKINTSLCDINNDTSNNDTINTCVYFVHDIKNEYLEIKDDNQKKYILQNIINISTIEGLFKLIESTIKVNRDPIDNSNLQINTKDVMYYNAVIECLFSNMIDYYIEIIKEKIDPKKIANVKQVNPILQTVECINGLNFDSIIKKINCIINRIKKKNTDLYKFSYYKLSVAYINNIAYVKNDVDKFIRLGILTLLVYVIGSETEKKASNKVRDARFSELTEDLKFEEITCNDASLSLYSALVKCIQHLIYKSSYKTGIIVESTYLCPPRVKEQDNELNHLHTFLSMFGAGRIFYYNDVRNLFIFDKDFTIKNKNQKIKHI
jgi:hypothetical protein